MKRRSVIVTPDAEDDLRKYLSYLRNKKKNPQAVKNVLSDFRETTQKLSDIADSIATPESAELNRRGLKRYNFLRHRYFVLFYTGDDGNVYITNIFHQLEDYEEKLR